MIHLETSRDFWRAYDYTLSQGAQLFERREDRLRYQCLAGYTALDFTLRDYWAETIVGEWPEIMTLLHAVMNHRESHEKLCAALEPWIKPHELVMTCHTLSKLRSPKAHVATLTEIVTVTLLLQDTRSRNAEYVNWIKSLLELAKLRAGLSLLAFNELTGQRTLKLLDQVRAGGAAVNPYFLSASPTPGRTREAA